MRNKFKTLAAIGLTIPIQLLLYLTMNNVAEIFTSINAESIFYAIVFGLLFIIILTIVKAFLEEFDSEFNVDDFKTLMDKNEEFYEDAYHQEDLDEFT